MGTELITRDEARFALARRIVVDAQNVRDKASVIENTVGIEYIFTMLANGYETRTIARRLGIGSEEFHMLITSSPLLRKRFLEAKAFRVAKKSTDVMEKYADAEELSKEEAAAMTFHGKNLDRFLHTKDEEKQTQGIVVNNTITVGNPQEVPKLPEELGDIFDAEFSVREEEQT